MEFMEKEYKLHHHAIMRQTHHWHVTLVATDPEQQGHGSQFMGHVSELADEVGVDCYLEANDEKNMRLYEKFGYETKGTSFCEPPEEWKQTGYLADVDGLTIHYMVRKLNNSI